MWNFLGKSRFRTEIQETHKTSHFCNRLQVLWRWLLLQLWILLVQYHIQTIGIPWVLSGASWTYTSRHVRSNLFVAIFSTASQAFRHVTDHYIIRYATHSLTSIQSLLHSMLIDLRSRGYAKHQPLVAIASSKCRGCCEVTWFFSQFQLMIAPSEVYFSEHTALGHVLIHSACRSLLAAFITNDDIFSCNQLCLQTAQIWTRDLLMSDPGP